jgi:hypothetical protein
MKKKTLLKSMEKNIPTKKITSRWNLPWITPDIRRLCQQKKRAWDSGVVNCKVFTYDIEGVKITTNYDVR